MSNANSSQFDKIRENYRFEEKDAKLLSNTYEIMKKYSNEFIEAFYNKIMSFHNATTYLKSDRLIDSHKQHLEKWFLSIFNGPYNEDYLYYLEGIGYRHFKVQLPSHYVNVSIAFIREYCTEIIKKEIPECRERIDTISALSKILDINLDVLTSAYIREEKNVFFISKRAETKLINFTRRFSHGLNLILVMGLIMLGLFVLGLFGYDVMHILRGDFEKGLLATLGSLLMLWVVIELVDTEVEHLKGAKFSVKVFVSVAMVAIIRKILVTSLKSEAVEAQYSLIAALAVLGGLYWLVSKSDQIKK